MGAIEKKEEEEIEEAPEEVKRRKFETTMMSLKELANVIKEADRAHVPENIREKMGAVDDFVATFVSDSNASEREDFQSKSQKVLEHWEENRKFFRQWSEDIDSKLKMRKSDIHKQQSELSKKQKEKIDLDNQK